MKQFYIQEMLDSIETERYELVPYDPQFGEYVLKFDFNELVIVNHARSFERSIMSFFIRDFDGEMDLRFNEDSLVSMNESNEKTHELLLNTFLENLQMNLNE